MKDWTGNTRAPISLLGASNHCKEERESNDYYATPRIAVEKLLEVETFSHNIWECACGEKAISNVLEEHGYEVWSTDLIDRCGNEVLDFLDTHTHTHTHQDIITNPPYSLAAEFVEHALDISENETKVAMLLKIQFLEGQKRRKLFEKYPPKTVYVFTKRIECAKNGNFSNSKGSAVCYCWFLWETGFNGNPIIKWI